jgi:hypothetical protein
LDINISSPLIQIPCEQEQIVEGDSLVLKDKTCLIVHLGAISVQSERATVVREDKEILVMLIKAQSQEAKVSF